MSARFVNIDRTTPMLLPPDLKEWVREDSQAHFLVEVLPQLDLSAAKINARGSGSEQYPPGMMLAVFIYCYAQGIFSSRQIERATHTHVEVRYLAANTHPDHDTLATFRRQNGDLLRSVFVQLLQYAQLCGLLKLGTIALDGTKLKAAAQKKQTRTLQQLEAELAQLEGQVDAVLRQAELAELEAVSTPELPALLSTASDRRAQLLAAKVELERQAQERAAAREAERERLAQAVPPRALPKKLPSQPRPTDTINLSDPASTLTPGKEGAFIQGYNAQLAVSVPESGAQLSLIVAAEVVRDTSDLGQLEPMVRQCHANLGTAPELALVDRGYDNSAHLVALEKRFGTRVLCPPVRSAKQKEGPCTSRYLWEQERRQRREARRAELAQPENQALYRRRNTTVEPAFGIIKEALGFRRFHLRGMAKVQLEWDLVALAFNCRRIAAAQRN